MFKQCRPLVNSPSLARVAIQLLGDKADRDVAQQIDKVLKSQPSQTPYSPPPLWKVLLARVGAVGDGPAWALAVLIGGAAFLATELVILRNCPQATQKSNLIGYHGISCGHAVIYTSFCDGARGRGHSINHCSCYFL